MRGLFLKIAREVWVGTLLIGLAMLGVNALLTFVIPKINEGIGQALDHLPMAREMLSALLGTDIGEQVTAQAMQSFLWVHPVVLALLWTHEINLSTRVPAGEVDRGTIDFVLGLPISRRGLYAAEVVTWLVTGAMVLAMGFLGHRLAAPTMPAELRPDTYSAMLVIVNLYCVYLAVGGIGFLVSACSSHRGRAMTSVFAIVLASFLLAFVAQFWQPAQQLAFLGVLEYYTPADILRTGQLPVRDVAVLLAIAAVTLLAGSEIVARRNLCTV